MMIELGKYETFMFDETKYPNWNMMSNEQKTKIIKEEYKNKNFGRPVILWCEDNTLQEI